MCDGVPLFANNKKAVYGKKTGSHTTAAKDLKIKEDEWRKFEFHFWDGTVPMDSYDETAHTIIQKIDPAIATLHAKKLVEKNFSTPEDIWKWLKDVPDQWKHIHDVENTKLKNFLFKNLTGMTPKQNEKALERQQKKLDLFVKHLSEVQWFKPNEKISKKDISLKVDFSLNLFKLPKANVEFRWLETTSDWGAARDAACGAARGAAWDAARDAAWGAAWGAACGAAWGAARGAAWDAARDAEFMVVEDLPSIKKLYKENPFTSLMDLWEMGLYPVGLINKKFVIYIPLVNGKKPELV